MGQVNKLVDHLIVYLQLHAEHLSNTKEQELKQDFIDCRRKVKELTDAAANKKSLTEAKQKLKKAKAAYHDMQKKRKLLKGSLAADMEAIYKKVGACREHYHGGSFDGGSCRAMMAYAKELLGLTMDLLVSKHHKPSTCKPIEDLRKEMKEYERALGLLDVVWSSVRGIDGLLPSDEFLTSLEANIEKARVAWLALGSIIDGNP